MLNENYLAEVSEWIESTILEINSTLASIEDLDDVKLAKKKNSAIYS